MKKYLFILIIAVGLVIFFVTLKPQNKKEDSYEIEVKKSEKVLLNNKATIDKEIPYDIWYFGMESVNINYNDKKYDFIEALKNDIVSKDTIEDYLLASNSEKKYLNDGGTVVHIFSDYSIIMCNTIENNRDIYIGNPDMSEALTNEFCGHHFNNECQFTRTYDVKAIYPTDDENYVKVTISEFQGELETVRISKSVNLQKGNAYEFTFTTHEEFKDTIKDIFNNSIIISTRITNKEGLSRIYDPICVLEEVSE